MSLGGGARGGGGPVQDLEIAQLQQQERATNQAADEQRRLKDEADRTNRYTTGLSGALDSTRNAARTLVGNRGLNYDDYASQIEQAILGQQQRVPYLDPNPAQYFDNSLVENTLNGIQSGRREQYGRQVNQQFTPNLDTTYFNDAADDPFIEAVLGRQRGEAQSALDIARSRGNLDDRGYSAALSRLGEMESAGRSTAQSLGSNVLQGYRERIRGIGNDAKSAASNYTLGNNFNLGDYTSRLENTRKDLSGRLGGDVQSALSGQNFFDIGDLITRGGVAQGPTNPRVNLDALAERERVRNTNRGVGGSGVF